MKLSEEDVARTKLETSKKRLKEIINKRVCHDICCAWRVDKGGLATNGGCRTDKMSKLEYRREMRELGKELVSLLWGMGDA